jgi:hypothetical protein
MTLHCIFSCQVLTTFCFLDTALHISITRTDDILFSWHCTTYFHNKDWRHSVFLTLHRIFPCQGLMTFCFHDTPLHILMPSTDDILFSWHCTAYSYDRSWQHSVFLKLHYLFLPQGLATFYSLTQCAACSHVCLALCIGLVSTLLLTSRISCWLASYGVHCCVATEKVIRTG